ncbi:NAD(P)H-dependent oxidoreductase [Kitasatospora sp. NBC_01287]|uniref:FMN-dependent NADH-azoreductase n=1 Tax=Kitasatospora sp. NBC_01287 TaxID=2903573 RepID=UPI0022595B79|nr:NAD(P)H-dependent oxidoreductase [Kitasatospora sp. NBC_01287]MCX4747629.1 NAD(P)H-dependent oxidoreductase [Kitasatospora sp. NBC_01287]
MPTLLHIDSSALTEGSVSREVAATFAREWQEAHPDGTVVYRDLGVSPVPHLSGTAISAQFTPAEQRTPEQHAEVAVREELIAELEQADAVLIGAPMYNFSVPSSLKAWLDQVVWMGRTGGEGGSVAGKPLTVVASRGGAYGEGTPRAEYEFLVSYLEKAFTGLLGMEVDFVVAEMTLARVNPALAQYIEHADASRAQAHTDAAAKARALVERLAERVAV